MQYTHIYLGLIEFNAQIMLKIWIFGPYAFQKQSSERTKIELCQLCFSVLQI